MALDLSAVAKKLIRQLAATSEMGVFYHVRKTGDSVDPLTGKVTKGTPIETAIDGALTNYSSSLIGTSNIVDGDLKLICTSELGYLAGDTVKVYCKNYAIVSAKQVNHAGAVQIWILQIRLS
jgi:hypothetical protein